MSSASSSHSPALLGIDTGGTFTDFVLLHEGTLRIHKVLSTPSAPEQAILQGIRELAVSLENLVVVHGTTVATNAVLEGKGVDTIFITNHGLADILTIGRQTRKQLYQLQPRTSRPPLPPSHCLETGGRLDANGEVIEELEPEALQKLLEQVRGRRPEAIAICLLFSFLDDRFEKMIAEAIPEDIFCCCSAQVLPEYGEFERGMATWLNAWVGPIVKRYLQRLDTALSDCSLSIMQSCAQTVSAKQAAGQAVRLLLSGPAGGLAGASHIAREMGLPLRLLTFDMGGTSTDVAVIDGRIRLTREGSIGDFPVAVPMVDMHTIGAGGGSIAYIDDGGVLQVGPKSAGARPGPACYGLGNQQATVTDANLVLGRLRADAFLGGRMPLDSEAAATAIDKLAQRLGLDRHAVATGIIAIANEHMAQALRKIATDQGIDPREFTLTSFGGAGGLHACALAEALGIERILIPCHAGVLSAFGMLTSPRGRDLTRSIVRPLDAITAADITDACEALDEQGRQALSQEGLADQVISSRWSLDIRYLGQASSIEIPLAGKTVDCQQIADSFNRRHEQLHGHRLSRPLELVNLRVSTTGPEPDFALPPPETGGDAASFDAANGDQPPLYHRHRLMPDETIHGPGLLTDDVSTTFIAANWQGRCDRNGHLLLQYRSTPTKA